MSLRETLRSTTHSFTVVILIKLEWHFKVLAHVNSLDAPMRWHIRWNIINSGQSFTFIHSLKWQPLAPIFHGYCSKLSLHMKNTALLGRGAAVLIIRHSLWMNGIGMLVGRVSARHRDKAIQSARIMPWHIIETRRLSFIMEKIGRRREDGMKMGKAHSKHGWRNFKDIFESF